MTRVLGIDPGSRKIGYALLEKKSGQIALIHSGTLNFEKESDFPLRMSSIYNTLKQIILTHHPDEVAMESLIYVKSPTALIKLAQARGAILAAVGECRPGKVFEYSPNLVKSSTVGHGHASKEGVQKGLSYLFGVREYTSHDESDAIAIALCHLVASKFPVSSLPKTSKRTKSGLAASLAHAFKE